MILTLPVSHLITPENYTHVPGIEALEFKNKTLALFGHELKKIFHSGMGIIEDGFIEYFDDIRDFLRTNDMMVFSCDLGPAAKNVVVEDYYYKARSEVLDPGTLKQLIAERLSYIRSNFDGEIALENLNYYPVAAYAHVCEPTFIEEITRENKVSLVLDIAHGLVSAGNMGIRPEDYFNKLPMDRVREVHVSGPFAHEGIWRDMHEEPGKDVMALLAEIQPQVPANTFLVVEYYKDFTRLVEIYGKLERHIDT